MASKTFEIAGGCIRCRMCGFASYHAADIKNQYCVKCDIFHEEVPPAVAAFIDHVEALEQALRQTLSLVTRGDMTSQFVYDENGKCIGTVAQCRPVWLALLEARKQK